MISLFIRGDSGVGNFVEFLLVHNCEREIRERDLLAFTRAAALNMNSS
jgi:hypothetical protein